MARSNAAAAGIVLVLVVAGVAVALGVFSGPVERGAPGTGGEAQVAVGARAEEFETSSSDSADPAANRVAVAAELEDSSTDSENAADREDQPRDRVVLVSGRVIDAHGQPIVGATVSAFDASDKVEGGRIAEVFGVEEVASLGGDKATSDQAGNFELWLGARGPFRLRATHPLHPAEAYSGEAESDRVEGVLIQMRAGAEIAGRLTGVPDGVEQVTVHWRPVQSGLAKHPGAMLIDLAGLVEELGVPIHGRSTKVEPDRTFLIQGLDPEGRFEVWGVRINEDGGKALTKCTERADVRAGARGVELAWREPLTIGFRVVGAETGEPIEEMRVAVGFVREITMIGMSVPLAATHPMPQRRFDAGRVHVDSLDVRDGASHTVALDVQAHGFKRHARQDIDVPRSGHVDLGVISLERAAVMRVKVTAEVSGEPIEGALVQLIEHDASTEEGKREISASTSVHVETKTEYPSSPEETMLDTGDDLPAMTAHTDADGVCEITIQAEGEVKVVVEADGFAPNHTAPFTAPQNGELEHGISLGRGGTAKVRVVDSRDRPVGSVFVQRTGPIEDDVETERADEDGELEFTLLTHGEHKFQIVGEDSDESTEGLRIALDGLLSEDGVVKAEFTEGKTVEVVLVKPLMCQLRGSVSVSGEPLERAQVRVVAATETDPVTAEAAAVVDSVLGGMLGTKSNNATTDLDGFFEFESVPVGARRIVVSHRDLAMPSELLVTLVEGENVHDLVIRATTLSGRVVGPDGEPIRRAKVSVLVDSDIAPRDAAVEMEQVSEALDGLFGSSESKREIRTDADGRFELRGVRPGKRLAVRVSARMHVAGSRVVEPVSEGARRDGIDFELVAAGRIKVDARNAKGAIATTASWAGPPMGDDEPRSMTGLLKRGRAMIDGLVPGRWKIELEGTMTKAPDAQFVEVGATETAAVVF